MVSPKATQAHGKLSPWGASRPSIIPRKPFQRCKVGCSCLHANIRKLEKRWDLWQIPYHSHRLTAFPSDGFRNEQGGARIEL